MSTVSALPAKNPSVAPVAAFLPLLLLLFLGSGCAALIYEIVWFQLLQLVIGSSAYSIGVLLGTFMGGMCLGSLGLSRLISRRHHPLRVYALLELAIGMVGLLVTLGMPLFDHLYIAAAAPGGSAVMLRAAVCAMCLLPPTILMGATLPAISRWIESTPRGVSWLGFFYGGNTAGAVIGCLFAGFYLLRNYDMTTATYFAVGINLTVAIIGIAISFVAPHDSNEPTMRAKSGSLDSASLQLTPTASPPIYLAIAFSGMAALGAEVVWTRLLSLLLGGTVYTFSIILAVFLFGLGVGSSAGALLARGTGTDETALDRAARARMALAWCQIFCVAGIAWSAYAVTQDLPWWPVDTTIAVRPAYNFEFDLGRCLWAILPATICWGASFPLALAAAITPGRDPAKIVGRVYAANTVGAIVGALFFSLYSISHFGSQTSQRILMVLAGLAAFSAIIPGLFVSRRASAPDAPPANLLGMTLTLLVAAGLPIAAISFLDRNSLDAVPWKLIAWGRTTAYRESRIGTADDDHGRPLYTGEGLNSSVAVVQTFEEGQTVYNFHVSGKVEASTLPEDMRLQLMLGHFPALFHPKPEKILIVGCGAGVTAGTFILHPDVKKIVICEIEPLIPQVVAQYFGPQNNDVVTRYDSGNSKGQLIDPRVEIVYDDARHYILTTKEKFDIITSDPIHPWVKGAATLYTKEYFDLVKQHLNPGGLVTQWVPLYESSEPVVKSEIATFFQAFPNGTIWNNDRNGIGYDTVVMGCNGDFKIDAKALEARLDKLVLVKGTLAQSNFKNTGDILKTYGGRAADLAPWLEDAQINSDKNLRLQYLAGESLNNDDAGLILRDLLAYRKYPEGLLTATPAQRDDLEKTWSLKLKPPETPSTLSAPAIR